MARKDKSVKLKQKSRFAAMEALRPQGGFPVPPRKAVAQARKRSKKLHYPVPPYPGAGPLQVYRWAQYEWWQLGRWRSIAGPVAALVALLTWEKEKTLREARWADVAKAEVIARAHEIEREALHPRPKKRKLLGIIPLPGRR